MLEGNRFWLMLHIGKDGRESRQAGLKKALSQLAKAWWSGIPNAFVIVSDQDIDSFWHGLSETLDPVEDIAVLGVIGSGELRTLGHPTDSDFRRVVLGLA